MLLRHVKQVHLKTSNAPSSVHITTCIGQSDKNNSHPCEFSSLSMYDLLVLNTDVETIACACSRCTADPFDCSPQSILCTWNICLNCMNFQKIRVHFVRLCREARHKSQLIIHKISYTSVTYQCVSFVLEEQCLTRIGPDRVISFGLCGWTNKEGEGWN